MWVQRPAFFDEIVPLLDRYAAVIVPELDVAYKHMHSLSDNRSYFDTKNHIVRQNAGDDVAQDRGVRPRRPDGDREYDLCHP